MACVKRGFELLERAFLDLYEVIFDQTNSREASPGSKDRKWNPWAGW